MDLNFSGTIFTSTIRDFFHRIGRTICYILGLIGIFAISQLILVVFYTLSYDYRIFFYLTHVQSTIAHFILAGTVSTLILRFALGFKRVIWWLWGTQTPDYRPNLAPPNTPTEDLIETARRKGGYWFWGGLAIAYFIALTGFYQVAFAETVFITEYPEVPLLSSVFDYLGSFPLINKLVGLTEILPAQNAISYLLIGAVLIPLSLGLYNISYVLEHNRFIRKNVWSNPRQTATIYFTVIPLGVLLIALLTWVFIVS